MTDPVSSVSGRSMWWRTALGLAVMAACFLWALPSFASYSDVADLLVHGFGAAGRTTIGALGVVAVFNLVAPSVSQMAALPNLSLRRAVWADWSTTTVTNLLPGGSALAIGVIWAMYVSFGLARSAIARSIVVTGFWDVFVKLGTPFIALGLLATQRPVDKTFVRAAAVGGVLFVLAGVLLFVVLSGPGSARWIGQRVDRVPILSDGWPSRLELLRSETVDLLKERGWSLTLWTIVGHLNLYILLVLCLRTVGVERSGLGWIAALAAFAFGRLVTALPLTPGGLGVLEVGLTGALSAMSEVSSAAIVAGVLLFRFFTFVVPLPLGAIGLAYWNAGRKRPAMTPGPT